MTVQNLYKEQFEELRKKLVFTYDVDDLESVGAFVETWTENDWENWSNNNITDDLVIKSFDGYCFGIDDFWCTAGKYEEYPDKED